jgi:hypothetical protein
VKISVFSTYSDRIAALNEVTAPNKQAYCDRHGYTFRNVGIDYDRHIDTLQIFQAVVQDNDITMLMGCDTAFTNFDIRIEDRAELSDPRPVISAEELGNNPINNDVMIWKRTPACLELLETIIRESADWLGHGWLWQNHIAERYLDRVLVKESRYMNATFVPWKREGDIVTQIPSPSSWEPGDWVIHALGLPSHRTRAEVIKWALGKVNNTNNPSHVVWHD